MASLLLSIRLCAPVLVGADISVGSARNGSESAARAACTVARKRKRIKLDILQHGRSGHNIVLSDDRSAE